MAITNYSELNTSIVNFMDDSDLSAYIPDFISLAESEIKADLELIETSTIATASTSTTDQYVALPDYFSSPIRLHINYNDEIYEVKFTTPDGLNRKFTSNAQRPTYVSVVDGQLEFNCVSDQAYEIELLYHKLTSIDGTTNTTNEVFPLYLNCYLYGALKHGAIFVKEDSSIYERQYEIFIEKIKLKNRRKKYPAPLRATTRYSK